MECQKCATLHVVDAGTVGDIAFDFEGQTLDEADGMHGVEVRQYENASIRGAPRRACDEMVAKTVAARKAFETRAGAQVGALDIVNHTVDGLGNRCRGRQRGRSPWSTIRLTASGTVVWLSISTQPPISASMLGVSN